MLNPYPRGNLWLYTPGKAESIEPVILEGLPPATFFHPLGLDVITSPGSNTSDLFVVNHGKDATTIEQFTLALSSDYFQHPVAVAMYVRTIKSKQFRSPNSIALTSPTSFYVTNDHFFTRRLPFPTGSVMPIVETFLGLPLGWVHHIRITDKGATKISWSAF